MDLEKIRQELDKTDSKIVELLEQRIKLCDDVAQFKIENNKPVYDEKREAQKIASVRDMAQGEFNRQAVEELFRQIMTVSRRYQYAAIRKNKAFDEQGFKRKAELKKDNINIVYQGVEGAYSHAATLKYFGEKATCYHVPKWEDAMQDVKSGKASYAVLPIENSSAGVVDDNYDLLVKYDNYIVAETYIPINHALLALPESTIEDITTVYSHPQALMQCSKYLNAHRTWEQISVENTAVAAKQVLDSGSVKQAAVASETAGKLYGLKVLEAPINYNSENITRFIIVGNEPMYLKSSSKISLMFELPHQSGSLYNILGNFIFNNINMLMIQSRPIPEKNWEYRFFVDIEGNLSDSAILNSLEGIKAETNKMRVLGNY